MPDFIDSFAKWLTPLFFLIYLLVAYYQAKNKHDWLKSNAKIFAIVLVFMSPIMLIRIVAFFFG